MIKVKRRFKRFLLSDLEDVREYEEILNDSLCTVTNREVQIEKTKHYGAEGQLSDITEFTTYLVHWEEQTL